MRSFINIVENAQFDAWFAGSKIVDPAGRPQRVYHGTMRAFDDFAKQDDRTNPYMWDDNGLGFFFTPDHGKALDGGPWSGAAGYAGVQQRDGETVASTGANVRPVFLSIKHPYTFGYSEFIDAIKGAGSGEQLRDELHALGYDGVIRMGFNGEPNTIVAFSPEQIRSTFTV